MTEVLKYLGTTLTNQNTIQEEIKKILNLGNAYYRSLQNLLSYSSYPKFKVSDKQNYNFA